MSVEKRIDDLDYDVGCAGKRSFSVFALAIEKRIVRMTRKVQKNIINFTNLNQVITGHEW